MSKALKIVLLFLVIAAVTAIERKAEPARAIDNYENIQRDIGMETSSIDDLVRTTFNLRSAADFACYCYPYACGSEWTYCTCYSSCNPACCLCHN